MIKIALHGAEFFAFHGLYPEEQILGNKFIVEIEVDFIPNNDLKEDEITNTVNYEQLYDIAVQQMNITRKLIETVAQAIADEIKRRFSFIKNVRVMIKKMNPQLNSKVGYSSVTVSS